MAAISDDVPDFQNGLALVERYSESVNKDDNSFEDKKLKYGYINRKGVEVIPCIYVVFLKYITNKIVQTWKS